ncbi:hypothetical protein BJY01DRAFT_250584 [Aspergillus pseudoustus]|uniref:ER-bound oxygenase mpaB/mpaB'/Rubber oxygenase catalytic domain-containing protein n=1 Tax=Aspergillus pseudoustus TaxID=1810923 RepID=A0ABR4JGU9_9EURO
MQHLPQETLINSPISEPTHLGDFMQELIFLLSGQYAILCQFAHPSLAKGSLEHSDFDKRVGARLQNTTTYLIATVFGTMEEKEAIFGLIHRLHSRVRGDEYSADDPELHKWTAVTVLVGWFTVHEVFLGKLPQEKLEHLYQEASIFATSLRMPATMWPSTLEDFWKYWNNNIDNLEITNEARQLCENLLHPKELPLWMRVGAPLARLVTIHILPDRLVKEYNLEKSKQATRIQYRLAVSFIRITYRLVPRSLKSAMFQRTVKKMQMSAVEIRRKGYW